MKKVIFLDLDGVLNSRAYDRERDWTKQSYIDETRLPLLKRIIDETGAEIVFSSTWREHWDQNAENCDEEGKYINECFSKYDLKISGKTPVMKGANKSDEISSYLETYSGEIDNYVILDDENFNWTDTMRQHVVKTNAFIGRGLSEEHVIKAVEILNKAEMKYEVVGWTSFRNDTHPHVLEMTLNDEPFQQIYDGKKTVEVRLNDEKRQRLQVGDVIQFLRKDHSEEAIRTEVVSLYKFSSFEELFSSDCFSKTGFYGYTVEEATSKMYGYYEQADEKKYGVLAIEIMVLTK